MAIVGGAEILIFPDQSVSMSSVGYVHNTSFSFFHV
jgi:hypothetical protein